MSRAAAIQATYSDLKIIKGRKVCQVVCEIPLEQAGAFVAAFGMPNPASETWVAIARLNKSPETEKAPDEKPARRWGDLPFSQQAAMRCGEGAFQKFMSERYGSTVTHDGAAEAVRAICGVSSRSDIGKTEDSTREWKSLDAEYQFWMRNAA